MITARVARVDGALSWFEEAEILEHRIITTENELWSFKFGTKEVLSFDEISYMIAQGFHINEWDLDDIPGEWFKVIFKDGTIVTEPKRWVKLPVFVGPM